MLNRCIKLGGSLLQRPEAIPGLLEVIVRFGADSFLLNGSGPFLYQANRLLSLASVRPVNAQASQLLAASRTLTSAVIAACHPRVALVNSLDTARSANRDGYVPLIESFATFGRESGQCCGTGVHACRLCIDAGIRCLVMLTDVDGVMSTDGQVLSQITPANLEAMGRTCIDIGVPKLLLQGHIQCVVLNGFHQDVLKRFLVTGEVSMGTRIC